MRAVPEHLRDAIHINYVYVFCAYILHILSDFFHHQVSPNGFTEF